MQNEVLELLQELASSKCLHVDIITRILQVYVMLSVVWGVVCPGRNFLENA